MCCKNDKSRIPCSWYTYRAETPRVLILGRPAARKNYVFLAVPKRMFPDRETMDRFLDQFTDPQAVEDDGHVAEGIFNFYFFMDQRAWSHAWIQGMQMGLRVKKLYGAKKGKVFRVTGIVAALCGMSIGMIADSGFSDHASFELYEGPWFVRVILQETDDERMDAVRRDWKVGNFDWGKWNPHEKRAGFYRVQLGGL